MTALLQLPLPIPCAVARQDAAPPRMGDATSSRVFPAFSTRLEAASPKLLRMGFAQGGA